MGKFVGDEKLLIFGYLVKLCNFKRKKNEWIKCY